MPQRPVQRHVSIPESGFCLFGPKLADIVLPSLVVSIPESGFCLFGRGIIYAVAILIGGFNP